MQQDILHDFVNGAKKLRQDIMTNNGHRQTIFSDTVLREMGLRLPRNLEELKTVPGINSEMVDRYGKNFMLLINNTREMYGSTTAIPRNRAPQRRQVNDEPSDGDYEEEDDEQVYDPNHQEVIDLCLDSDDEVAVPVQDIESNYSYGESDEDSLHRSHHFTQPLDPEVEEFNNRLTQTANANVVRSRATTSKRAPRASSAGPKKRGSYRNSGGGHGRSNFHGVRKRASNKATSSKPSAAPRRAVGGSSRRGNAGPGAGVDGGGRTEGGNGWTSILGMPT